MTAHRLKPLIAGLLPTGTLLLSLLPCVAGAFGLGEAELRSFIGQPLRMRIPVIADSVDEVGCVVVRSRGDDVPAPHDVRSEVVTLHDRLYLDLRTAQPINDLTIALRVTAGCTNAVTREYVLFVDPPPEVALPASSGADEAPRSSAATTAGAATPGLTSNLSNSGEPTGPARARNSRKRGQAPAVARDTQATAGAPVALANPPDTSRPVAPARHRASVPPPQAAAAPAKTDRLVLMHDVDEPALSMTEQVGKPDATSPTDDEHTRQVQRDEARLVAILTNHNPDEIVSERELALQRQLSDLSTNINTLSKQVTEVSARNRALESSRMPPWILWALVTITVLALLTASWLTWRYRALQKRMAETPWWEQTKIAPLSMLGEHPDYDHDHGPASTEGVEVVEVMPNTVPRPAPTSTDAGLHETTPAVVPPPKPASEMSTSSSGRQSVPSLTQYRPPAPPPVSLWPKAEPDLSHEREAEPTHSYIPFGLVSVTGSMDEQVSNETNPVTLDLDLELPEFAPPAPASAKPPPIVLPPLDLNSSKAAARAASAAATQVGSSVTPAPSTGAGGAAPQGSEARVDALPAAPPPDPAPPLRTDDVLATIPLASSESHAPEPANVHFRLVQFASVLDQIDELERLREPAKAIALLRQYVLRDEAIPTLFWLLLFHYYKQVNKKPVYDALGEHFSRRYRRTMVRWDETLSSRAPQSGLKDLPEIDERMREHWGTEAGLEEIRALLCDRDQADVIVFNEQLQRDLLHLTKVFPLES